MNHKYEINKLESTKDSNYLSAIKIYIDVTPADVRTDTNEIAKAIDHPGLFEKRKMYFFSLHYQKKVIGFAQFAFIPNMKIIFMDYLAIADEYKKNSIFYPFFSMFLLYFNDENLNYEYFITEIGAQNDDTYIDHDSAFLRKVLAMESFNIIAGPYRQPSLGYNKEESNVDAHLYLKTSAPLNNLSSDLFLKLIYEILFEHYDDWYKIMLSESEYEDYHHHIEKEYQWIKSELHEQKKVNLVDCISSECKYYSPSCTAVYKSSVNTAGYAPQKEKNTPKFPMAIVGIIATFSCSLLFYLLLSYLRISISSFSAVYAATTTLAVGFTAYYFNHKN